MTTNLWNTQSPTTRIDFYIKIDEHKKHLVYLKNVKSTFKKKHSDLFKNSVANSDFYQKIKIQKAKLQLRSMKVNSQRLNTQNYQSNNLQSPNMSYSKMNNSILSSTGSPNKYTKFRNWQISTQNKKILKKLQNVKASPDVCKSKLGHKYSNSDLKYRINLQKTKYKNIDFTRQAQRLLKGQKIKFSRIDISNLENQYKIQNFKIKPINLDWKISKKSILQCEKQGIVTPNVIR